MIRDTMTVILRNRRDVENGFYFYRDMRGEL